MTDTMTPDTPPPAEPVTDPADPAFYVGPDAEARAEKAAKLRDGLYVAQTKLRAAADYVQFLGGGRATKADVEEQAGKLIADAQTALSDAIANLPEDPPSDSSSPTEPAPEPPPSF